MFFLLRFAENYSFFAVIKNNSNYPELPIFTLYSLITNFIQIMATTAPNIFLVPYQS